MNYTITNCSSAELLRTGRREGEGRGGRAPNVYSFARITRIFARAVYASLYSFHICAADIYAWEFIREALCRLIHFTLSGNLYTCVYVYVYTNTKPNIVLLETLTLQCATLSRTVYPH